MKLEERLLCGLVLVAQLAFDPVIRFPGPVCFHPRTTGLAMKDQFCSLPIKEDYKLD